MKKTIVIDLMSEKSISESEKKKTRLENQGYELVDTVQGFTKVSLVYQKQ